MAKVDLRSQTVLTLTGKRRLNLEQMSLTNFRVSQLHYAEKIGMIGSNKSHDFEQPIREFYFSVAKLCYSKICLLFRLLVLPILECEKMKQKFAQIGAITTKLPKSKVFFQNNLLELKNGKQKNKKQIITYF